MAGYTRQDTNDNIATGKVINASDFDNEFDQIVAAFHASTGHSHDGTTAEGPRITVIGPSGKFSTDTNAFFPTNTTTVGLGKTDKTWTDLYVDNIKIDGNVISSTDTDGNISLTPNGAGSVILPKAIQIQDTSADHQYVLAVSELADDRTVTLPLLGGNDEFVFKDHTQTLTNKTLTAPVFGGISTTASGNLQVKPATNILEVQGNGSDTEGQITLNCHANSHGQTIKAQPHSEGITNTMLLPKGANSTLVSLVSTDTLTNKTLTSPSISGNTTFADGSFDFDIASHDGTNGLKLGGTLVTATAAELNYVDVTTLGTSQASKAVTADANGDVILSEELTAKSYNETHATLTSASTVAINFELGNVFLVTAGHNITFTFGSPPANTLAYGFTLKVTQDGTGSRTLTWPSSVKWAGGSAPGLTGTASSVDVFTFLTDGTGGLGATYYGFLAGANLSGSGGTSS